MSPRIAVPATKPTSARYADSDTREDIMRVRESLRAAVDLLDSKPRPRHWWYELHDGTRLVCLDRFTLMCRALLRAAQRTGDPSIMREMRGHVRLAVANQMQAILRGFEQCDDLPLCQLNAVVARELGEGLAAFAGYLANPSESTKETARLEMAEVADVAELVVAR